MVDPTLFELHRTCVEELGQLTWQREPDINAVVAHLGDGWRVTVQPDPAEGFRLHVENQKAAPAVRLEEPTVAELAASFRSLTNQLAVHDLDEQWP